MRRIQAKFASLAKLGHVPEELRDAQENLLKAQNDVEQAQTLITKAVIPAVRDSEAPG
jgi:hypothetical protein